MAIDEKIKNRKLQCNINRAAVKISALCSGKIDKYKSMKSDKILPSQQHAILTEAKFTYSPLWKAFEKQTKTIDKHGKTSWSFKIFKTY